MLLQLAGNGIGKIENIKIICVECASVAGCELAYFSYSDFVQVFYFQKLHKCGFDPVLRILPAFVILCIHHILHYSNT